MIGILTGLVTSLATGAIGKLFVDKFFGSATDIVGKYLNKEISEAEAKAQLGKAMVDSAARVEESDNELVAKTFDTFWRTAQQTPLMVKIWAVSALSALATVLFLLIGAPLLEWGYGGDLPFSDTHTYTAIGVFLFLMGGGTVVLKNGLPKGSPLANASAEMRK